jgi:hypothetical protein
VVAVRPVDDPHQVLLQRRVRSRQIRRLRQQTGRGDAACITPAPQRDLAQDDRDLGSNEVRRAEHVVHEVVVQLLRERGPGHRARDRVIRKIFLEESGQEPGIGQGGPR